MPLLRHLQHWLTGQGPCLQVADFVPETHPIRQWADTRKINRLWVKERRITLNVDGGALDRLVATTDGSSQHPPVLLRRRGDVVTPLSLARF